MKKYFSIVYLLMLCGSTISNAQNEDSLKLRMDIAKQLKLFLFSQMSFGQLTEQELESYFNKEIKFQLLESRGFKDLEFYYIPNQAVIEYRSNDIIYTRNMPIESLNEKIIVARTKISGMLFSIQGLRDNTIKYITSHRSSYIDPLNGCDYLKSKKKKFKCLYVEGLDIEKYFK